MLRGLKYRNSRLINNLLINIFEVMANYCNNLGQPFQPRVELLSGKKTPFRFP